MAVLIDTCKMRVIEFIWAIFSNTGFLRYPYLYFTHEQHTPECLRLKSRASWPPPFLKGNKGITNDNYY